MDNGWRRETTIREYTKSGIRGEVVYVAPCGKKFKQYPDIIRVSLTLHSFFCKQFYISLCSTSRSVESPISNGKTSASAQSSLLAISCGLRDKCMKMGRRPIIGIQSMRWEKRLTKYDGRMGGSQERGTSPPTLRLHGSPMALCPSHWKTWGARCRSNISFCSDSRQKPWRETRGNEKSRSRLNCRRRP